MNSNKGFTLIELLVVVAIIGVLASVVLASLNSARGKGADANIKSNLANSRSQAEILFNTRTANLDTYLNVCTNGLVDGVKGIGSMVLAAAQATGLSSYATDAIGTNTTATCNDATGANWAAEVPLKTAGQMWCVDSSGKSTQTAGSTLTTAVDVACN